jgi:hypothetical protein
LKLPPAFVAGHVVAPADDDQDRQGPGRVEQRLFVIVETFSLSGGARRGPSRRRVRL